MSSSTCSIQGLLYKLCTCKFYCLLVKPHVDCYLPYQTLPRPAQPNQTLSNLDKLFKTLTDLTKPQLDLPSLPNTIKFDSHKAFSFRTQCKFALLETP